MVQWFTYFIPCVLGLFSLIAVRSLLARGVGRWWWGTLLGSVLVAVALGAWFTFFFEVVTRSGVRCIGFPFAWKLFVRFPGGHGAEWTRWRTFADFAALDMVLFASLSVYPVWLANTLWRFMLARSKKGQGKS